MSSSLYMLPSVLWHCCLGGSKGIRLVKNWVVGCWRRCLGWGADLHIAQQMPLPHTLFCSSKSRLVLTFLVFGRPYYRWSLWHDVSFVVCLSVCDVLYCGKAVRLSEKVSEGVNRKPGSKSSIFGSPPYFYFRFRRYGHRDGHFCLIFARITQQSVLDGTNGLSSSKPCAYFRIMWSSVSFVCLSVCLSSVTFCTVVKWYVLAKKCLKDWIGN